MKRVLIVSGVTLCLLAGSSVSFEAEQGRVNGCYLKNNGQLRVVQRESDCQASEIAVSWNRSRSGARSKGKDASVAAIRTLGGSENFAYAINNAGEIVGASRLRSGDTHAFVYSHGEVIDLSPFNSGIVQTVGPTSINNQRQIASGTMVAGVYVPALFEADTQEVTTLGSLGGVTSFGFSGAATAVNNFGEAVGYAYLDQINRHAFLYRNGSMIDLGSFGGYSVAMDINDTATVVGFASMTIFGPAHAVVWRGSMIDIDPFGEGSANSESTASAVNNRDDVVGYGLTQDGTAFHGFLLRKGVVADLGTLSGGRNSYAQGINDSGVAVGTADVPYLDVCEKDGELVPCIKYKLAAFAHDGNHMTNLNTLIPGDAGWDLISAYGINNRGEIVGYGLLDGRFRAFVLDFKH
jgi:probable HAF family extracellular repeat protein